MYMLLTIDVVSDTSFVYNQYIDMDAQTYDAYVEEVLSRSDVDRAGRRPRRSRQDITASVGLICPTGAFFVRKESFYAYTHFHRAR